MNLQDSIKQLGIMKLYDYLDKDPEKNIPKIIDMIEKVDKKGILSKELKVIKPHLLPDRGGRGEAYQGEILPQGQPRRGTDQESHRA